MASARKTRGVIGWAWVLERYGPGQRYLDALEEARRAKRGTWAFKDNIHPWEFKKQKYRNKAPKPLCPAESCRGYLMRKSGRFGEFLGCSEYPRCRYSCSVAG
ncbi:topoisomerase DNA-binding C4 zinc finger domain-containing protein [Mesorhizobium sp.]|uniref:topoisomerase DNA-binding C4 zinc finger domain-containing protein n=1 Tax=Mesorhizobium sp. TaxID=1871066 RepID=UPI00345A4497